MPPIVLSAADLDEGLDILEAVLEAVMETVLESSASLADEAETEAKESGHSSKTAEPDCVSS